MADAGGPYMAFPIAPRQNVCALVTAAPLQVASRLFGCFGLKLPGAAEAIVLQSGRSVVIDHEIAEGGFSYVYQVHDTETLERLAMKKIMCQSTEQRHGVVHEMGVHKKCRHKHLMPLVDYTVTHSPLPDQSTYYLLFPLVENGSLRQYIDSYRARQAYMPERALLDIFTKVATAVLFLHSQEPALVHRDIKPENVLLNHDLEPLLTDFGSIVEGDIKISTRGDALKAQETASIHSSMAYRAPELYDVATGAVLTSRTDVWAMGCLLYAMAFGYSPFECSISDAGQIKVIEVTYLGVLGRSSFRRSPSTRRW
ncbi:NAK protein kinase [Saprolegnia parasitica CBS 223.65]|uniref:non-specific serine/threonine protein kinase n=1 Tax=Saprolegnia parasitica (strain CBS 223.65) TaxID=695850 RepID=A0A067CDE8_SAPPC|nr:NAK protein kinase [Saprolegnia parasitica CBS 223.65]KDO28533.1 NAK protein kinase [Saprolegnia parasitica CBS 223.65]|eukprot:XP_012200599.1 NAK protein kinase [Saprolegnia parasitica CBS 223.65]